jgi:CPA1 family monovalent cation:H+ antiporter
MTVPSAVAAFLGLILLAASAHPISGKLKLPFVVVLAFFATLVSVFVKFSPAYSSSMLSFYSYFEANPISSDVLFYALLPILLFQGAVGMDVRHLFKDGVAILLLAIGAVLISIGVIGVLLYLVTGISIFVCLLLGSIVATTDPSAVITVFRSLGAPARLTRLVEGESLLNDATAIATFTVVLAALGTDTPPSFQSIFVSLVSGFGLGAFLGGVLGVAIASSLSVFKDFKEVQITIAICMPFIIFLGVEQIPTASGVVAVVMSGLALGTIGRSRFTKENFSFLKRLLDQLSDWATGLIILLSALIIPFAINVINWIDIAFVFIVIAGSFLARFIVLWGVAPLLSSVGMMTPIEGRMKVALLLGSLRGAMTIALALTVVESDISKELSRFVVITATGYTLFTLLVQGTTLRFVLSVLGLDKLPAAEQAFRDQTLKEALFQTKQSTLRFGKRIGVNIDENKGFLFKHETRLETYANNSAYETLSEKEKLRLGLVALVSQERSLLQSQQTSTSLKPGLSDTYFYTLDVMRDGSRDRGRLGYLEAGRSLLKTPKVLRLYIWIHNTLGIEGPLSHYLASRYHLLMVMRIMVLQTFWHAKTRLSPLFGVRISEILVDILEKRLEEITSHLEDIRLQYPAFARNLDEAVLASYALSEERREIDNLESEGLIEEDVAKSLRKEGDLLAKYLAHPGRVDIKRPRPALLRTLAPFKGFSDSQLARLSKKMRSFHASEKDIIYRPGDKIKYIYFISTGAVLIERKDLKLKLGPGTSFGQVRLLNPALEAATVTVIADSHFFRLPVSVFFEFLNEMPSWKSDLEELTNER